MTYATSRLEIIVDSRGAEKRAKETSQALDALERAGLRATKSTNKLSQSAGGMAGEMRRLRTLTLAASGAFLGIGTAGAVLGALAHQASQTAAEIANLSELANANTDQFQQWGYAAKSVGVEQDKLADILKDTNDRVGDFLSTGGGEMKDFFENIAPKIGMTAEEFRNLSGPQALQKFYNGLEAANLSQAEMVFYMESMADEATALIPLLRNGGEQFERLSREADKLNVVLSEMEIQRLRDVRREFSQLEQQLTTETARAVSQFDDMLKSSLEGISWGINNVARGFNVFMDEFRADEAKRSIAGINNELEAVFDNKRRLEQRIDMFGEDSVQGQQAAAALREVKAEYDTLIDSKKRLLQQGPAVTPNEALELDRVETGFSGVSKEVERMASAAKQAHDPIKDLLDDLDRVKDRYVGASSLGGLFDDQRLAQGMNGIQGSIAQQNVGNAIESQAMQGKPSVQGLDPMYSGPFGEAQRIEQERQQLQAWYDEKIAMYQQYRQLETQNASQYNAVIQQLEAQKAAEMVSIQQQEAMARVQGYGQMFGSLAGLSAQFAGDSAGITRGLIAFQQAANLATAISSIATGQARSFAELGPIAGTIKAIELAAMGASLVSTIKGISAPAAPSFETSDYSGMYDKGGRIPVGKFGIVGEYGPEIVNGPASVTSRKDTAKLLEERSQPAPQFNMSFHVNGNPDQKQLAMMQQAAQQGAELGYRRVLQDFQSGGNIRKTAGV